MDTTQILIASIISFSVIGLALFLVTRGKVNISHTHDVGQETKALGEKITEQFAESVKDITHAAQNGIEKVVELASPIADGAGNILDGTGNILQALADRIKVKQVELNTLKSQSISLGQEIERLKNRQINLTEVTAQLKLALIGVDLNYTSIDRHEIESEERGYFTKESTTEYLGIRTANCKIQIGVDIEQLRFEIAPEYRILVSGLRTPVIVGLKNIKVNTHLDEIRKFTKRGTVLPGKSEIISNDVRITKCAEEHHSKVLREIQSIQSIEHLTEPNAHFALAFLQACLSSGGYMVEESETPLANPLRFGELCVTLNKMLADRITEVSSQFVEIEDRSRQVEADMLSIISGAC